jgi:cytochrome c oxidase subunit 4
MRRYVTTFAALLLLTSLTLGLSFAPLGAWQTPTALLIALAKSTLVVLFFMHLAEHRASSQVAFLVSILLAATLIGLAWLDVVTRGNVDLRPPIAGESRAAS